jgi:hypothetical protein
LLVLISGCFNTPQSVSDAKIDEVIRLVTTHTTEINPFTKETSNVVNRAKNRFPGIEFEWIVKQTSQDQYLAGYRKKAPPNRPTGDFYEVNTQSKTVVDINGNAALEIKYNIAAFDLSSLFHSQVKRSELFVDNKEIGLDGSVETSNKGITWLVGAIITNKYDKPIIKVKADCRITLLFNDGKVIQKGRYYSSRIQPVLPEINENAPWMPGENRVFQLATEHIGVVYQEYKPTAVIGEILIRAKGAFDDKVTGRIVRAYLDWSNIKTTNPSDVIIRGFMDGLFSSMEYDPLEPDYEVEVASEPEKLALRSGSPGESNSEKPFKRQETGNDCTIKNGLPPDGVVLAYYNELSDQGKKALAISRWNKPSQRIVNSINSTTAIFSKIRLETIAADCDTAIIKAIVVDSNEGKEWILIVELISSGTQWKIKAIRGE